MVKKQMYFFVILFITLFFPLFSIAKNIDNQNVATNSLDFTQRDQTLNIIEKYLNNIKTLKSKFIQISPDGSFAGGEFYLKKPNKMRWQYEPPTPILMVSKGKFITYYDYELDQITDIPIDNSLAGIFAKDDISLTNDDLIAKNVFMNEERFAVTLIYKKNPESGEISLEFSRNPMMLKNITILDGGGKKTSISLSDIIYNISINDNLFSRPASKIFKKKMHRY